MTDDPAPHCAHHPGQGLRLRRLGIDTHQEAVIYMPRDCHVCRAEGFQARSRVLVRANGQSILATVNQTTSGLLAPGEAALSEAAWDRLGAEEGMSVSLRHAPTVRSHAHLRGKIHGNRLGREAMREVVEDVVAGRLSDIYLSGFITACAGQLDFDEVVSLTQAMIDTGERLHWGSGLVVDKHCVGGLLGNRTTPIVVGIVAACGLTIPKTSSRAITSPAGTADVMETLAPVDLDEAAMRRVVSATHGCVVWGGSSRLSPADDILIRVERALDLDSTGQLVASVLSKKVAAGSTHVLIDIPHGPKAKVRSVGAAQQLGRLLEGVGKLVGIDVRALLTDGTRPVGRGFGPALEARDVVAVLQNRPDAPADLRQRALAVAGAVLEFSPSITHGGGAAVAEQVLKDGAAWDKFQAICEAQGGMREPPSAALTHTFEAQVRGRVVELDNRRLSRAAKFAGAPADPAAGLELHVGLGEQVEAGQPLFTIHAQARGELGYALEYLAGEPDLVRLESGS
jgi:thymidine phosphorylase